MNWKINASWENEMLNKIAQFNKTLIHNRRLEKDSRQLLCYNSLFLVRRQSLKSSSYKILSLSKHIFSFYIFFELLQMCKYDTIILTNNWDTVPDQFLLWCKCVPIYRLISTKPKHDTTKYLCLNSAYLKSTQSTLKSVSL